MQFSHYFLLEWKKLSETVTITVMPGRWELGTSPTCNMQSLKKVIANSFIWSPILKSISFQNRVSLSIRSMIHWDPWWSYLSLPTSVIVSCNLLSLLSHRLLWMLYTLVFCSGNFSLNTIFYFPWISLFLENGLPLIPTQFSSSVKAFKVHGVCVCCWLLVNTGQRK